MLNFSKNSRLPKTIGTNKADRRSRPTVLITGPETGGLAARVASSLQVWLAGGKPLYMTAERYRTDLSFDAVILSGGSDIGDNLAGTTDIPAAKRTLREKLLDGLRYPTSIFFLSNNSKKDVDHDRNVFEIKVLDEALKNARPVLGICRGTQLLNCRLGGNLKKSIFPYYRDKPLPVGMTPCKSVRFETSSLLAEIMTTAATRVNALHHQVIDTVAQPFTPVAYEKTGLIQAIEAPQLSIVAVQWHPEYLVYQKKQRRLFQWLVNRGRRAALRSVR